MPYHPWVALRGTGQIVKLLVDPRDGRAHVLAPVEGDQFCASEGMIRFHCGEHLLDGLEGRIALLEIAQEVECTADDGLHVPTHLEAPLHLGEDT